MPASDFSDHPTVQAIDAAIDAITYLREGGTKTVNVDPAVWQQFITAPKPTAPAPQPIAPTPMPEMPPPSRALRAATNDANDTPEARAEALSELTSVIQGCTNCKYAAEMRLFGQGCTYHPKVFIVNGACLSGESAMAMGSRLEGDAGDLLRKMFAAIHLTEAEIYLTSTLKCPVTGRPEQDCLQNCAKHLHKEIDLVKPDLIVMLGDVAAKAVINGSMAASGKVGQWHLYAGKIPAIKLYHPMRILMLDDTFARPLKQENWEALKLIQARLRADA